MRSPITLTLFALLTLQAKAVACEPPVLPVVPPSAQATVPMKTHVEEDYFSFQYPANWQLERSGSKPPYLIVTSYRMTPGGGLALKQAIKTDVTLLPQSMQALINKPPTGDDIKISRTRHLTIAGKPAYQRWYRSLGFDFPDTVVTYVQYSDRQTAVLSSYYTASNPRAVPQIQQIHQSFRILK